VEAGSYRVKGLTYIDEDPNMVKALIESNLSKLKTTNVMTQIRVKKVHERETNCKYQVNLLLNGSGTHIASEAINNNLYAALAESFEKVRFQINR
jgi:ribosome-associated translation inhibitor RaiA